MRKLTIFGISVITALWLVIPPRITNAGTPVPVVLHMRITAYASVPDETDSTPFITANGTHVRDGIVATNLLPFGTKIQLPALFGDKIFTVEDRMSPHYKNTIDIWMTTKAKAVYFGLAHTNVVVLPSPSSTATLAISVK